MKLHLTPKIIALTVLCLLSSPAISKKSPPELNPPAPISQANIDKAIKHLEPRAKELLKLTGVPGMAIAVVQGDKLIFAKGLGLRTLGTDLAVDADTVFQLASFSKSIGATVVAAAVSDGSVQWDDPVAKHLKGFTLSNPDVGAKVTIADMYSHRSGLPAEAGDALEDLGYQRLDIIKRLTYLPLDPFLVTYHYTNFGLTAAAQATADANKLSWEDLSKQKLYKPLKMTSTSSRWSDYHNAPNRAALHFKNSEGKWVHGARQPDQQSPAGGVSSSAHDLAKWMILQLHDGEYQGKQVIKKTAIDAMRHLPDNVRPLVPENDTNFYRLGMKVLTDKTGRQRYSHSGLFTEGASTTYEMLPDAKLGIVVLTNGVGLSPKGGMAVGIPETLAAEFYDLVEYGELPFDRYKEMAAMFAAMVPHLSDLAGKRPPAKPAPASPSEQLIGTYDNDYFGPLTVEAINGKLQFTMGPKQMAFSLTHWNGDTFAFIPINEAKDAPSTIDFTLAQEGQPATLTIPYYNASGLGVFRKR